MDFQAVEDRWSEELGQVAPSRFMSRYIIHTCVSLQILFSHLDSAFLVKSAFYTSSHVIVIYIVANVGGTLVPAWLIAHSSSDKSMS